MRKILPAFLCLLPSVALATSVNPPDWDDISGSLFETPTTGLYAVMPTVFAGIGVLLVIFWMWRSARKIVGGRTKSA